MALDTALDPADAWNLVKRNAAALRGLIPGMLTFLGAGNVPLERIFEEVYRRVLNSRTQLAVLKDVTGLDTYVATIKPLYVATTEIQAVIDKQDEVLAWIDTNAAGLNLSGDTAANYIANGSVATNRFTNGQTTQLQARLTELQALIT